MIPDNIKNIAAFVLSGMIIFISSCNNPADKSVQKKKPTGKDIEKVNTYLVEKDRERILNYIERRNLQMKETSSGLWYMIINEGYGDSFREGDRITMNYRCFLLDGEICYSSDETGPRTVQIGKTNLEPGLVEGLKMLRPGAEAMFILPPYLAWGLHGDDNAIPPRSVIVYEVKILNRTEKTR